MRGLPAESQTTELAGWPSRPPGGADPDAYHSPVNFEVLAVLGREEWPGPAGIRSRLKVMIECIAGPPNPVRSCSAHKAAIRIPILKNLKKLNVLLE